jgi:hypothetical protein
VALKEPVTRDGEDRMVVLSADEYQRLKRRDRQVMSLVDFTAEDIAAIGRVEPPGESAQFDGEVEM